MDTLYDLLGALPHDNAEDLRTAFRRAVKGTHPDLRPDDPEAALKFREIVRASEILGDAEQRAAYDHLLGLARLEQETVSKQQAVLTRIHRFASGVIALAGVSIVTVGGYLLFIHMSAASVAPLDNVDIAIRASSPAIAAARLAVPPDAADNSASTATLESASMPGEVIAPTGIKPQTNAESDPPANVGPAVGLAASEARSLRARGMSAYRHGDLNGAIADLDQALQLDPKFLPAYIDRGTILYRMKKYGRAFADVASAKRIEDADRSKSASVPTMARKPRFDQAVISALFTPSSQRRKPARRLLQEEAFAPLSER